MRVSSALAQVLWELEAPHRTLLHSQVLSVLHEQGLGKMGGASDIVFR